MPKLGLIGFPLSHSFSKKYFTDKFENEKLLNWQYELYPIQNIETIRQFIDNEKDLIGLNVTIPHKVSVVSYIDEVSAEAKEIGAVNTLKIIRNKKSTKIIGYNTDVYGFEKSLIDFLSAQKIENALVLGTGGASKAVTYILKKLNIDFKLVSRNPNKNCIIYSDIDENLILNSKLIINTTPLGIFPDVESLPSINYKAITSNHFLYDLVYNPEETLFLKEGKKQGAKVKNGLEMLHLQAEKAWQIWNDKV